MRVLVAACATALIASCFVDRRSNDFECESELQCSDGRVCEEGFCVGVSVPDCPSECNAGCDVVNMTCNVACASPGQCNNVDCPLDYHCNIQCTSPSSCNSIDCRSAASCTIACTASNSCSSIECGDNRCTVSCTNATACDSVDCSSSCACDVACTDCLPDCPDGDIGECTGATGSPCSSVPAGCSTCDL